MRPLADEIPLGRLGDRAGTVRLRCLSGVGAVELHNRHVAAGGRGFCQVATVAGSSVHNPAR